MCVIFGAMMYFYVSIVRYFNAHQRVFEQHMQSTHKAASLAKERALTRFTAIILLSYMVCFFPWSVEFMYCLAYNDFYAVNLTLVVAICTCADYVVNPLMIIMYNSKINAIVKHAFNCNTASSATTNVPQHPPITSASARDVHLTEHHSATSMPSASPKISPIILPPLKITRNYQPRTSSNEPFSTGAVNKVVINI